MFATKSNNLYRDQCEHLTSTYHPNGMLDRDQRTAKSLSAFSKMASETYSVQKCSQSKNKCCYTLHNSNVNAIKPCKQHRRQQNESVLFIYNFSNNNVNSSSPGQSDSCRASNNKIAFYQLPSPTGPSRPCLASSGQVSVADCTNERPQLPSAEPSNKSKPSASSHSPSSCYKSKKLNSLLICICFWLLILQKARAMPVTRTCEEYKEAIRAVIDQAKMSYHVNYGILEDFTQKYFRQTHTAVNETWHHKKFDSLKPATHTARQKEPDSYMKTDSGSLKHLMDGFTKKMVSEELQQLHEQLQILESAFQFVSEESNKVDEYDPAIYDSHLGYVRMLKEELGDSMDKLEIPKVDFAAPNLNDNCSKEVRDFILMREHLTVLRYLLDAFEILHSACPVDSC